jgi:hypothetical protein
MDLLPDDLVPLPGNKRKEPDLPFAEAEQARKRTLLQEQSFRVLSAQNAVATAEAKTAGYKRILQLLDERRRQPLTNEDAARLVNTDHESLLTLPFVPPDVSNITELFGPPISRAECFGCMRGVGVAKAVSSESLNVITHLLNEGVRTLGLDVLACQVSIYYTENVQLPANKLLRSGERPLPDWTPRGVYDHITEHIDCAPLTRITVRRQLREHLDILRSGGLYKVSSEALRSGRPLDKSDLIVDPVRHKQFLETAKAVISLCEESERPLFKTVGAPEHHLLAPIATMDKANNSKLKSVFS